ncbi:LacI family transcriptional regulator [Belliella sp. DSM 111904]|uniref:LacI family transcriptional regulator n=1 Tax=Belliella filtrata TaxID=2923435 RepID=A0ABS9UXL7_9BACT|nr:LacI family DNA-binding transcriptional regulator [Belliella filtrata]MCH7408916.1 LacI family transcriptional regulator [Belliella filtrata]
MGRRRVSLKDIAKELGVSISTVSRGLKDHYDISPELKKKIKDLAEKWNYTPNPLAMGLLKQKTKTIGVIVPDIVTYFYASIISGIESKATENGYYIVIASSQESIEKEKENVKNLLDLRVDGFIVCLSQSTNSFEHFDEIGDSEIPLVFFDRICRKKEFSSVIIDNVSAAKELTMHLVENGYSNIAHIAGPSHLNISKERIEGYKYGLDQCKLPYREELLEHCDLSIDDAARATNKLLRNHPLPDAIFGVNDTVIFSAMKEIRKRNLKVPDDIALVGFTDEFHATVVEPNLTAVTHPTFEMGREAFSLLLEEIENEVSRDIKQTVLQAKLIPRESSSFKKANKVQ